MFPFQECREILMTKTKTSEIPDDRMGLLLYGMRLLIKDGLHFMDGNRARDAREWLKKADEKLKESK